MGVDAAPEGLGGGVGGVGGQGGEVVDEAVLGGLDLLEPGFERGGLGVGAGLLVAGPGGEQFAEPFFAAGGEGVGLQPAAQFGRGRGRGGRRRWRGGRGPWRRGGGWCGRGCRRSRCSRLWGRGRGGFWCGRPSAAGRSCTASGTAAGRTAWRWGAGRWCRPSWWRARRPPPGRCPRWPGRRSRDGWGPVTSATDRPGRACRAGCGRRPGSRCIWGCGASRRPRRGSSRRVGGRVGGQVGVERWHDGVDGELVHGPPGVDLLDDGGAVRVEGQPGLGQSRRRPWTGWGG